MQALSLCSIVALTISIDPDNYTDEYTFLDRLQRNPRLQPYEFWRLVADSTVIVQHVCSVAIFVCCFTGIFQERVSPVTVVSWGSISTIISWVLLDFWMGQEEKAKMSAEETAAKHLDGEEPSSASSATSSSAYLLKDGEVYTALSTLPNGSTSELRPQSSHSISALPAHSSTGVSAPGGHPTGAPTFAPYSSVPPYGDRSLSLSPRVQKRLATVKSSILIYCALLGLSPILKSLTKSTTSDSIWAVSSWLMLLNVAFFDYGGGVGAKCVDLKVPESWVIALI